MAQTPDCSQCHKYSQILEQIIRTLYVSLEESDIERKTTIEVLLQSLHKVAQ